MPVDLAKTYHFIGIGGAGMSALAWLLHKRGGRVTGSDRSESAVTSRLQQAGIPIAIGHDAQNVGQADLVVATAAVHDDNVEIQEARRRAIEIVSRAEMLGRVMADYRVRIGIAGTHGKTTTTAMVGAVLMEAGLDPTVLVGGDWRRIGGNARIGRSDVFVTEACEAFDSFLYLKPSIAVVTNIEPDHLDYYGDFEAVLRSFRAFVSGVDPDGAVIASGDDRKTIDLADGRRVMEYGFSQEALLRAAEYRPLGLGGAAEIVLDGHLLGTLELSVPGEKNVLNALAAVAVGLELDVPFEIAARALAGFTGVDRRFEVLGEIAGVMVVDDYAHHPTEIETTISAARQLRPTRLVAVFQPHLYSRTQHFLDEFAASLSLADEVIVTDVYAAREEPIRGAGAEDIARLINDRLQGRARFIPKKEDIPDLLLEEVEAGDLVLILGAGDISDVGREFAKRLKQSTGDEVRCASNG